MAQQDKKNREESSWKTFWKTEALVTVVSLIVFGAIIVTAIIVFGNK